MAPKTQYRKTDIGLIPSDWKVQKLGNISEISRGGSPRPIADYIAIDNEGYNWLRIGDIDENSKYINETEEKIKPSGLKKTTLVKKGELILSNSMSFGRPYILNIETCIHDGWLALRELSKDVSIDYLYYILNSHRTQYEFKSLAAGSGVRNLNIQLANSVLIPLPQLEEQERIAEVLSTWDEAIELQKKLIEEKEKLLKQVTKDLIFGQTRVGSENNNFIETKYGSYPSAWDFVNIKKIAKEVNNSNGDNEYTVLSCTKYDGLVPSLEYFGRQIYSDDTSNYKIVKRNQFAYATNHIEEGSIGYQDLMDFGLVSPMYTVFETNNNVNDIYLYRVLKTERYRHIFEINTSGTVNRRGSLRWSEFSIIKVPLPPIEEQNEIVEILKTFEKELDLQKQKLELLKLQKKGLMQVLLTGKVRVKA